MPLSLTFDELLRYTNEERDKWRRYLASQPLAVDAAVQPGSRFATVGKLIDHIFLVERRHVQRLMQLPLSNATGLTGNNAPPRCAGSWNNTCTTWMTTWQTSSGFSKCGNSSGR
jgi:hypothetical protein